MHQDERALGVLPPDHEPRATAYVAQMLALIGLLIDKGLAYPAPTAMCITACEVSLHMAACRVKAWMNCGRRARGDRRFQAGSAGFRAVEGSQTRRTCLGIAVGSGRPGWHIECSAMSADLLGKHFDIHGGGQDLQFPHHENEIAQSEGAHGCTFVNYWMHNGFVRVDNEKMSKSLGNFFTIREVLQQYDAEVVRFFILRAHYRSPLNYSDAHLDDAKMR